MLPDTPLLLAFTLASLLVIISPGPDTFYVIARSVGEGRFSGLVASSGISAGLVVHLSAATLGLSSLFVYAPIAYDIVRYVGAAYLLYLAWGAFFPKNGSEFAAGDDGRRISRIRTFREAMLTNVFNPKVAIFFIAFLPQFASPEKGAIALQIASLGVLFMIAGFLYLAAVAIGFGWVGDWLKRQRRFWQIQRWVMGTTLGGLAVWLALPERR